MSTLHLSLPVALSPREQYVKSQELSEALNQRRQVEIEKKLATGDYSKKLKELDKTIYELGDTVRTGKENRKVRCKERFNADARTIETVRTDTQQIVATRPLKDQERQPRLPGTDDDQLELEEPDPDDDENDAANH